MSPNTYVCVWRYRTQSEHHQVPPPAPSCRLCLVWSIPPPLGGFCCSISHRLHCFPDTHSRAHTPRRTGRQTCTHASANPLTTRQCPEQIKGLHISKCIPNVPPLHGSHPSVIPSCTFASSCTGLCTSLLLLLLLLLLLMLLHPPTSSSSTTSGNRPVCLCSWDDRAASLRRGKKCPGKHQKWRKSEKDSRKGY